MADTLMYIPNDDTQNYPSCRLQLAVETFERSTSNSIKDTKVVKPIRKKFL